MLLYEAINKLAQVATAGDLEAEVKKANSEFFGRTGQVYEEDRTFEARMGLFLEWYLFDRPLTAQGVPPVEYFLKNPPPEWTPEELRALEENRTHLHSVFELGKVKDQLVAVIDLATKKKYSVIERRGTSGLLKGDLFEGRLFQVDHKLCFSGSMLFHPRGARKFIRNLLKEQPEKLKDNLLSLSAMGLKMERYRHVPLEKIYSQSQSMGN